MWAADAVISPFLWRNTAGTYSAVDFSPAMLRELSISLQREGLTNVKTVHSKWEDFEEPYDADYVLSVNSLYRVCYMREALEKIARYGKKGFIIVRTLLKPYLYSLYDELSLNYRRNNDYMMMPMMFWNMGIHAEVSFTHYDKVLRYADWEAAGERNGGGSGRNVVLEL